MVESRQYHRVKVNLDAEIETFSDQGMKTSAVLVELGKGGCLIKSDSLLGCGRVVIVEVSLPKKNVRLVSRVLYESFSEIGYCQGVRFETCKDKLPVDLSEYIDSIIPFFYRTKHISVVNSTYEEAGG